MVPTPRLTNNPWPADTPPVAPLLPWQTATPTRDASRHSPYSLAPGTPCCGGSRGRFLYRLGRKPRLQLERLCVCRDASARHGPGYSPHTLVPVLAHP